MRHIEAPAESGATLQTYDKSAQNQLLNAIATQTARFSNAEADARGREQTRLFSRGDVLDPTTLLGKLTTLEKTIGENDLRQTKAFESERERMKKLFSDKLDQAQQVNEVQDQRDAAARERLRTEREEERERRDLDKYVETEAKQRKLKEQKQQEQEKLKEENKQKMEDDRVEREFAAKYNELDRKAKMDALTAEATIKELQEQIEGHTMTGRGWEAEKAQLREQLRLAQETFQRAQRDIQNTEKDRNALQKTLEKVRSDNERDRQIHQQQLDRLSEEQHKAAARLAQMSSPQPSPTKMERARTPKRDRAASPRPSSSALLTETAPDAATPSPDFMSRTNKRRAVPRQEVPPDRSLWGNTKRVVNAVVFGSNLEDDDSYENEGGMPIDRPGEGPVPTDLQQQ